MNVKSGLDLHSKFHRHQRPVIWVPQKFQIRLNSRLLAPQGRHNAPIKMKFDRNCMLRITCLLFAERWQPRNISFTIDVWFFGLGDIWKHIYLGPRKPRRIVILFFALYKYSYLLTYLLTSVGIGFQTPYPRKHMCTSQGKFSNLILDSVFIDYVTFKYFWPSLAYTCLSWFPIWCPPPRWILKTDAYIVLFAVLFAVQQYCANAKRTKYKQIEFLL